MQAYSSQSSQAQWPLHVLCHILTSLELRTVAWKKNTDVIASVYTYVLEGVIHVVLIIGSLPAAWNLLQPLTRAPLAFTYPNLVQDCWAAPPPSAERYQIAEPGLASLRLLDQSHLTPLLSQNVGHCVFGASTLIETALFRGYIIMNLNDSNYASRRKDRAIR